MQQQKRESVTFDFDVPVQVALAYPDGRAYDFGSYQRVMYSLVDGRVMWVSPEWSAKIAFARVQPNQPFWLVKRRKGRLDLYLEDPTPQRDETDIEESDIMRDMRLSINQVERDKRNGHTPPAPVTAPRPAPLRQAPAEVERQQQPQPTRAIARAPEAQPLPWQAHIASEGNALIDVFAQVLAHARQAHGEAVNHEDVRTLVITTYIQHAKGGRG